MFVQFAAHFFFRYVFSFRDDISYRGVNFESVRNRTEIAKMQRVFKQRGHATFFFFPTLQSRAHIHLEMLLAATTTLERMP